MLQQTIAQRAWQSMQEYAQVGTLLSQLTGPPETFLELPDEFVIGNYELKKGLTPASFTLDALASITFPIPTNSNPFQDFLICQKLILTQMHIKKFS